MLKIVSKGNFESVQEFSFIEDKKLGSGSFGTVKLALHNKTNRMYALKIVTLFSSRLAWQTSPPNPKSNWLKGRSNSTPKLTTPTSSKYGTPSTTRKTFTWWWSTQKWGTCFTSKTAKMCFQNPKPSSSSPKPYKLSFTYTIMTSFIEI